MIVYNDTVTINGQIYPPNNFKINNTIISPNVTGEFTLKAPVTYGKIDTKSKQALTKPH